MKKNVVFGLLAIMLTFGFIGCGDDSTDDVFSSKDETVSNNVDTLGLVGTNVRSSDENVATVEFNSDKSNIKITSVAQGSANIIVTASGNNATIPVTVSATGSITIGTIVKYSVSESPYAGTWASNQFSMQMVVDGDLLAIIQGSNEEDIAKGNLVISNSDVTLTITHKWLNDSSTWSNTQNDLDSLLSYFGGSLVLQGTVNGSNVGSIMLEHLVKLDPNAIRKSISITSISHIGKMAGITLVASDETTHVAYRSGIVGNDGTLTVNLNKYNSFIPWNETGNFYIQLRVFPDEGGPPEYTYSTNQIITIGNESVVVAFSELTILN